MVRQPIIGIPCFAMVRADTGRPIYASNQAYVRAIVHAGGAPVLIPPIDVAESRLAVLGRLDALLFAGGSDVDPGLYGEEPIPECGPSDPERDRMELELAQWALAERLPTLGICRGMQVLNVATGGSLYQDIPVELPGAIDHQSAGKARSHIAHSIQVEKGSLIAGILTDSRNDSRAGVNSFHHQAVRRLGRGFCATAVADDGIVEAMEMADTPFIVAVQYHPEELQDYPTSRRLFQDFVEAARDRTRS